MNKFAVVCLMALAVSGSVVRSDDADQVLNVMVETESFAANDDGSEPAVNLPKEHALFRDYCLTAQGEIKGYVAEKMNGAAANVYSILLTSASDIGREVLQAQTQQVAEGSAIIEEAAKQTPKAVTTEEQVEETVQNIQGQSLFQRVSMAVKNVILAIVEAARAALFKQIEELKDTLGAENLRMKIEDACSSISNELQPRLSRKLMEAKKEIKDASTAAPDAAEIQAILTGARVDNIGCTLTGRISKVAKFCDILKVAGSAIYQLVGI